MDIAERHRLSIDRWFYPCSHRMHRGLASMYEGDDRFRQRIDTHGEGLTPFLAEAIRATRHATRTEGLRLDMELAAQIQKETKLLREPTRMPYREVEFSVEDPDGHVIVLGEQLADDVNVPSATE